MLACHGSAVILDAMKILATAALVLWSMPVAAQEQGGFVTCLGNDTIGVERFVRTRDSIAGEIISRMPNTARYSYVVRTTPDGAVQSYSVQQYKSAAPGAPRALRYDADFRGDSVRMTRTGDGATHHSTMPNLPGSVPVYEPTFGEYEAPIQRAIAANGKPVPVAAFYFDLTFPGTAVRTAPDLVLFSTSVGTIRATIDAQGRLLSATTPGGTLQAIVTRVPPPDLDKWANEFLAREARGKGLATLSPRSMVKAKVGGVQVVVDYSRPSRRGRVIFGGVVPYNTIWRTGANAATGLFVDRNVMLGNTRVPAGAYTLFSLPTATDWTLVVSKRTKEWGTEYDSTADLARIPMQMTTAAHPVEQFTISVNGGALTFSWDNRVGRVVLQPAGAQATSSAR